MLQNDNRARSNLKLNIEQWSYGFVGSDFLRLKDSATGESQAHYIWQDMTVGGFICINDLPNALSIVRARQKTEDKEEIYQSCPM